MTTWFYFRRELREVPHTNPQTRRSHFNLRMKMSFPTRNEGWRERERGEDGPDEICMQEC